ncbi:MAG: GSCFA domain-containing protein [Lentimicrobiaceae bacterium]|nr:GSCFA domain-containing protein [Lentimicrobiaceae bacterium]
MQNNSFRTEVPPQKAKYTISHKDSILLMGSCFAENIGRKLTKYKFSTDINPFGILFNPLSIAQSLNTLADSFLFQEDDLHFYNGEWISFFHHGKFSKSNKKECLDTINEKLVESRAFLQKTDFLILTLGTSISYSYQGTVVANCHKIPQKEFQKQMLDIQDIVSPLASSIEKVKAVNSKIRILFTVSPVRYIKNEMTENTLSKARLVVATHELLHRIENSDYFPAYELMLDDLRDYRFYNEDMIHPSPTAVDYIWDSFANSFFGYETKKTNSLIEEIASAKNHRIKNPFADESKRFKEEQLKKIQRLQADFPLLDFEEDIKYFS